MSKPERFSNATGAPYTEDGNWDIVGNNAPVFFSRQAGLRNPRSQMGELVMACVVLKPGIVLAADELVAYCWQSLAHPVAGRQPCSTSLVASISQPKEPSSWAGTRQETEDVGRTLERKRDST